MSRGRGDISCKVYVGDLPRDASEKELERAFSYYGPLKAVWVARNPPGFAFVEFEDHRDAEDAVRGMDGKYICGVRARVEFSTGRVRPKPWLREGRDRDRRGPATRGPPRYDDYEGPDRRRRSRSRSFDRDRKRSYSPCRGSRDRDYSPRRSSRDRSRSKDRRRSRSKSYSRSRSRD